VPRRQPEGRLSGVTCVLGAKYFVSRQTFLWSHLTQLDQMKDSPTA
jgi:hypothetical protein